MKYLFVLLLFVSGCAEWIHKNPYLIPQNIPITCKGALCCYANNKERTTFTCVSSDEGSNIVIYIKLLEL